MCVYVGGGGGLEGKALYVFFGRVAGGEVVGGGEAVLFYFFNSVSSWLL